MNAYLIGCVAFLGSLLGVLLAALIMQPLTAPAPIQNVELRPDPEPARFGVDWDKINHRKGCNCCKCGTSCGCNRDSGTSEKK